VYNQWWPSGVLRGYFFAFHLLNIVNNNQLLRGVIQAVTQNGNDY